MKRLAIVLFAISTLFHALNGEVEICYANQHQTAKTTASINLRKSPGLYGEVIGNIAKGETLVINNKHEDWYQVTYDTDVFGYKGWVYGKFIALNGTPPKESEPDGIAVGAMDIETKQEKMMPSTPDAGDTAVSIPSSQATSSIPNAPTQSAVETKTATEPTTPAHIKSARIKSEKEMEDIRDVLIEIKKRKAELAALKQTKSSKNRFGSKTSYSIGPEGEDISENSGTLSFLSFKIILLICISLILVVLIISFVSLSFSLKSHRLLSSLYNDIIHLSRTSTPLPEKDHEKRLHTRIISLFEVDFVVQGRAYWGIIHDISASGAFVETRESFTIGQRLTMTYKSPGNENPVKMKGVIIRVEPKGFGVKFLPDHHKDDETNNSH